MSSEAERGRLYAALAVSVVVLGAALFVILSGDAYTDDSAKWAYGIVGVIVGYWLK